MRRWLVACAFAAVCFAEGGGGGEAFAAGASCTGDLSLSLDYVHATVAYDASGFSPDCLDGLASRGLPDDGRWPAATGGTWSVHGHVPNAHLSALPDGHWTVQLDLDLQPEDVLRVSLPFT